MKHLAQTNHRTLLVHGHEVVEQVDQAHGFNVLDIDTGCAFGGALTAFRWPERELVQVKAKATYCAR